MDAPIEIKSCCVWCGKETVEHFPRAKTDTAIVRRMDNDHVICHSCIKHLVVIVLDQENRMEREELRRLRIDTTEQSAFDAPRGD